MVMLFQDIFTGIFLAWLILVAWLLWRHALGGGEHIHRLHLILNENTKHSVETAREASEAANKSAEAALRAVEINARVVTLLEQQINGEDRRA